jgi:hypothetical protein
MAIPKRRSMSALEPKANKQKWLDFASFVRGQDVSGNVCRSNVSLSVSENDEAHCQFDRPEARPSKNASFRLVPPNALRAETNLLAKLLALDVAACGPHRSSVPLLENVYMYR